MTLVHNTTTPDRETAGDDYRKRFAGEVGAYFLARQTQTITRALKQLGASSPLDILEVGGGHGQITRNLLELGHRVWVQGSDESCFQYLAPLRAEYPGRLEFVTSSLWQLPFSERRFDVVIALRLLAHVESWRELIAEMGRVGLSLIVDFGAVSALNVLSPLLFGLKRKIEGNTRPYFNYSCAQICGHLDTIGFKLVCMEREFFFPMGLHRALRSAKLSRCMEAGADGLGLTRLLGSPVVLTARRDG